MYNIHWHFVVNLEYLKYLISDLFFKFNKYIQQECPIRNTLSESHPSNHIGTYYYHKRSWGHWDTQKKYIWSGKGLEKGKMEGNPK